MSILNGKSKNRLREIRVGQPNAIGKCLVEFLNAGTVQFADRFDVFSVSEADKAIKNYLRIAGLKSEQTAVDLIRNEIQAKSTQVEQVALNLVYQPQSFAELEVNHSRLRQPVMGGILRVGETLNIIAPPKTGKSFLSVGLAWCVATGRSWLSHEVQQGRVLIVDNELHPETLVNRLGRIADAMEIPHSERDGIDIVSLRGQLASIVQIAAMLEAEPGKYRLIVIDALYRTLPHGTSENDNAAMMAVYNHLDALAERTGTAIVVIHHSSKGDQSGKGITDIGAGAGAISRAADSHLAIRQHEELGHFVLEAVTRSFKSPDPVSIRFDYPVWTATTLTPEVRKPSRVNQEAQKRADDEAKKKILDALPDGKGLKQAVLKSRIGYGIERIQRVSDMLQKEGLINIRRKKAVNGKQKFIVYYKTHTESRTENRTE